MQSHKVVYTDTMTGQDIELVGHITIIKNGVPKSFDLDMDGDTWKTLLAIYAKGETPRDDSNVVPFKRQGAKPARATTNRQYNDNVRTWAKDNGANKLPERGRIPQSVIDAFEAKDPDKIPAQYVQAVAQAPAPKPAAKKATSNANPNMTEGKTTTIKKTAAKAPAFKAAKAG